MSYFSRSDEERLRRANRQVLDDITSSFTVADKAKLDGIAAGATVGATWDVNITDQPLVLFYQYWLMGD